MLWNRVEATEATVTLLTGKIYMPTLASQPTGGASTSSCKRQMRSEQEIFDDLTNLCRSKGFVHAIAQICFRDNIVGFHDQLKAEDMAKLFSESRLIRTEVTTLIGLMIGAPIDFTLPAPTIVSSYIERSEALLKELHEVILEPAKKAISSNDTAAQNPNPFKSGEILREVIFYGGESAYTSQYRDLALKKYSADSAWLLREKGICMEVALEACRGICQILDTRLVETVKSLEGKPIDERTMLPGFTFSCDEIAVYIRQPVESVKAVVEAFTVPNSDRNATFTSLHSFNKAYEFPFIRKGSDDFILLQYYGITEALYETPFYWMCDDKTYTETAFRNRGNFTEAFSAERLTSVFGRHCVFRNVEILESKSKVSGEIDVLVIFGNRAIVVQAKSKKLTLAARKGNDLQLQSDFKLAVQRAVDQAHTCAELLGKPSVILRCKDGTPVLPTGGLHTIFPVSVVADHYPALAFQTRQFLKNRSNELIVPPLVIDVFGLDAIVEMLNSPLRLLSYLSLRAQYGNKFWISHEHMLLSFHLTHNLWLEEDIDYELLHDSVALPLDVAMAVRRDGIPGAKTPDGILTRMDGTHFARIIKEIEDETNPAAIDLGLMLLELGEDTVRAINEGIVRLLDATAADGGLHGTTISISTASTGLTIHCSRLDRNEAEIELWNRCGWWKNSRNANSWFGLAIRPDGAIQLAGKLTTALNIHKQIEANPSNSRSSYQLNMASGRKAMRKIVRNERCPCGSGKKFKHCCIDL